MVVLFHLLADGGKIPPYLCRWNFPPLADGGIFPPACRWWKKISTCLRMVEKFHQVKWNFSTCLQMVDKNFHLLADGGKISQNGGCGRVEFFHPFIDGGKIPPCRWRFWTTFIGGIFHHIRLQCTEKLDSRGYVRVKKFRRYVYSF